jgi:CheY-like chemotaxis protein
VYVETKTSRRVVEGKERSPLRRVVQTREVTKMNADNRILVVDDDPAFVKATQAVLEEHGYQVDTAADGEEALAKMKENKPDLVLLDVMMRWILDGVGVSQKMMDQEALRHIPIIMVTSILSTEHRDMFPTDKYLHVDSWLNKPCPPSQLISEIDRTLTRRREFQKKRVSGE